MQSPTSHSQIPNPEIGRELLELDSASIDFGLPALVRALVQLRASQVKRCDACIEFHLLRSIEAGEQVARIFALDSWRQTSLFSPAECAALALAEDLMGVSGGCRTTSEEVWAEARRHYSGPILAALVVQIMKVEAWHGLDGRGAFPTFCIGK